MYSVMLAAMLTAGADTTSFGWLRCHGCHSSCHSCAFSSCHGCCYTSCHGCHVIAHGCHSYCSGCYSSCHGCSRCSGVVVVVGGYHGCHGCCYSSCHGCWVSSHCCHSGGVVYTQQARTIQVQLNPQPLPPGQRGGSGGMGMAGAGGMGMGPRNDMERKAVEDLLRRLRAGEKKGPEGKRIEEKKIERKEFKRDEQAAVPADKARVVVNLPADARLWVDQVECPLPGTVRSFDTPNLDPQTSYSYTLRVVVQRNGQSVEDSRRVQLTPGQQVAVDFSGVGAVRTASAE